MAGVFSQGSQRPSLPTGSENFVRGQAFRSIADAFDEVVGPGSKNRAIDSLPREIREAFRFGSLVPSGWYPMEWFLALHRAARALAPGMATLHRRIGRLSTQHDMNTVHRFLLRLASPAIAFGQTPRIIGLYIKEHSSEQLEKGTGMLRLRVRIPGASAELWEDAAGSAEAILEATGASRVQVTVDPSASLGSALLTARWLE